MQIIYIHQYFRTPSMSGITRSYEFARRLVSAGHEVHMVTSDTDMRRNRGWYESCEDGIQVHWLPVEYSNKMSYSRRIRAFTAFAFAAAAKAASLDGDVVFATSTPLTVALPGAYAAKRNRIPLVLEVRDLWPEVPIAIGALRNPLSKAAARWLEKFAYRSSKHVVALSPAMKEGIVKAGVSPSKVTLIPNSCDFSLFDVPKSAGREFRRSRSWLQERQLVVYTGTLGKANGVRYLVKLAASVRRRNRDIRFLIVGSGAEQSLVQQEATRLGVLNDNLFMMNSVRKQEIAAILSAANLATSLFINLKELRANSPNKFFDGLAAGRPIAVNHGGWLADLIRERDIGLVLDPVDMEAAADRLVASLNDHDWRIGACKRAKQTGKELFDRDQLAEKLESVLAEAAGEVNGNSREATTRRAA